MSAPHESQTVLAGSTDGSEVTSDDATSSHAWRSLPTVRTLAATLAALLLVGCAGDDDAPAADTASPGTTTVTSELVTSELVTSEVVTTPATSDATRDGTGDADDDQGGDLDDAVRPKGFELVAAVVTTPDGERCELCLWLADDAEQRSRGLMFVTDLGDGDGMAFRYPAPHTGRFWMKDTILPLSIAFYAPDGTFLDAFDMEPCTTPTCERYRTPIDFLVAVEVAQGDLDELGMAPGSSLELLDVECHTEP